MNAIGASVSWSNLMYWMAPRNAQRRTDKGGLGAVLDPPANKSGGNRQELYNFAHVALPVLLGNATRGVLKYGSKAERSFNQKRPRVRQKQLRIPVHNLFCYERSRRPFMTPRRDLTNPMGLSTALSARRSSLDFPTA